MNEVEEAFVKTFIVRDKRERWLSLLGLQKSRRKLTDRLAHVFESDLDQRFVYDKEEPPEKIEVQVQKTLEEWKTHNPKQLCHIIACKREKDGQKMRLVDAELDYDLTFGAIIIIAPHKLAFYHPERDNISKQPLKLLFRPN